VLILVTEAILARVADALEQDMEEIMVSMELRRLLVLEQGDLPLMVDSF
jgi:hypothetical protein